MSLSDDVNLINLRANFKRVFNKEEQGRWGTPIEKREHWELKANCRIQACCGCERELQSLRFVEMPNPHCGGCNVTFCEECIEMAKEALDELK